jgi:C1A family cysteine protease
MYKPRKYGLKPERPTNLFVHRGAYLPRSVDLRRSGGMPEVWDQFGLGACSAFALGSVVQYAVRRLLGETFVPSPFFIYYNERVTGKVREDMGSTLSTSIRALCKYGVCSEASCGCALDPPSATAFDEAAAGYEVLGVIQVDQDIDSIKYAILKGFPVVLGIQVYGSFVSFVVAETGIVPEPGGDPLGCHTICLIGYDDDHQAFIARNSWGLEWGKDGHCYLPYGYISNQHLASDPWIITAMSKPFV